MNDYASTQNGEFRRINQAIDGGSAAVLNAVSVLSTSEANQNFTTLSSINGLGRDVQTQVNATNVNMLQNFNQLGIQNVQGFNSIGAQVQNATNQIVNGQVAAAAAAAACCCEIKALIVSDGNATRALINDNTIQALRDKNNDLATQVSNNTQNQYLLQTILTHIVPTANSAIV